MSLPPDLLDELARVFARVALDRLLKERGAPEPAADGEAGNPERIIVASEAGEVGSDINRD